jgi:hypothetical protein
VETLQTFGALFQIPHYFIIGHFCIVKLKCYVLMLLQVSQKYRVSLKVRHLEVLWNTEKLFKKSNIYFYDTVTPEMLECIHDNIVKRANACLDANGQNFENLF